MGESKAIGMDAIGLAELLRRVTAGDSSAWAELHRVHAPALFRFCRGALRTKEDAEDATIEIFMKLPQKLGSYDPSRPFRGWLYKVASNHCWDMLRRRRNRQDLETLEDLERLPLKSQDPGQLERMLSEHAAEELRGGLAKLSDRSRMALVLRYFGDMSYGEIAEALGLRKALVGVLLLRARQQLRNALDGSDIALPRGATGGKHE